MRGQGTEIDLGWDLNESLRRLAVVCNECKEHISEIIDMLLCSIWRRSVDPANNSKLFISFHENLKIANLYEYDFSEQLF